MSTSSLNQYHVINPAELYPVQITLTTIDQLKMNWFFSKVSWVTLLYAWGNVVWFLLAFFGQIVMFIWLPFGRYACLQPYILYHNVWVKCTFNIGGCFMMCGCPCEDIVCVYIPSVLFYACEQDLSCQLADYGAAGPRFPGLVAQFVELEEQECQDSFVYVSL